MRRAGQIALAIVLLMAALAVAPWSVRNRPISPAHAGIIQVPTPDLSDVTKATETPKPDDDGGGDDGGGSGDDGSGDDGGSTGGDDGDDGDGGILDDGEDGEDGDGKGDGKGKDGEDGKKGDDGKKGGKDKDGVDLTRGGKRGKKGAKKDEDVVPGSIANRIPGAYDTRKLVSVAAQLRGLGVSAAEVVKRVYPPFIIAGPASWVDTWHAPRYGPAPGQIRQHEGQDVFCDYGDPILAPVPGTVSFSDGGLGGITARVHEADGSYWYMTHLSDLNTEQLNQGDSVTIGTVLGYCGNSGNASTTPPHVHFGWYQPNGAAKNPMRPLIDWLRAAERRVEIVVSKKTKQRIKNKAVFRTARLFGDGFAPDRSEFRVAGESLWASGSDPAIGTYALAEAALRAALATHGLDYENVGSSLAPQAEEEPVAAVLDADSALARLLESRRVSVHEAGD